MQLFTLSFKACLQFARMNRANRANKSRELSDQSHELIDWSRECRDVLNDYKMAAFSSCKKILFVLVLLRRRWKFKINAWLHVKEVRIRRCWVRQLFKERKEKGEYHLLIKDTRLFEEDFFFRQFKMTPVKFEELLSYVALYIVKSAQTREPISPAEGICVTLRYLATGDAQRTVADNYRMSKAIFLQTNQRKMFL